MTSEVGPPPEKEEAATQGSAPAQRQAVGNNSSAENSTTPPSSARESTPEVRRLLRDLCDLSTANPQRPEALPLHDLDALKRGLADRAGEIYPPLFKYARIVGDELKMASISGDPPKKSGSCAVALKGDKAGCWYDRATGNGGDALDTLRHATGKKGRELYEYAAGLVGSTRAKPKPNGKANGYDGKANEIAITLGGCQSPKNTKVETYLSSRGIQLPSDCQDLLSHPDLNDYAAQIGRPAMVAVIRDPVTGEPTGGLHRTFLRDDGSGKADMDKPKKMLGPSVGVVMLGSMTDAGALGIGEGIETSLAGGQIKGVPVWAALSAGNLQRFNFPPGLKKLFIFADCGNGGMDAANKLCRRAMAAGIDAWIYKPNGGDDFADDLKRGLHSAGYPPFRPADSQPDISDMQKQEDEGDTAPEPAIAKQLSRPRRKIELLHLRDMKARVEDRSIVYGLLNEGEISAIVGESSTGKTFFALDMALSVALGWDWFGRPTRKMGVVYIAAEAGLGIQNRVMAFVKEYPESATAAFAAIVSPVNLREPNADINPVIETIRDDAPELSVGLIVVDTLSRAMAGGNENNSDDMGAFIGNMDRLRYATGAHVSIVHHFGKDSSRGPRGHSSFHAALDTEIVVDRDTATGISIAKVTKQRELPTEGRIGFKLRTVVVGRDQNDQSVTSCVVEPTEAVTSARNGKKLSGAAAVGLQQLQNCMADVAKELPASTYIPVGAVGVTLFQWRAYLEKASVINTEGNPREQFRRIRMTLQDRGFIGVWDEFVWLSHAVTGASQ
jgi:hypothetical protein